MQIESMGSEGGADASMGSQYSLPATVMLRQANIMNFALETQNNRDYGCKYKLIHPMLHLL